MREILIKKEDFGNTIALIENEKVIEKYEENNEKERMEGNIYLGIVQRILPGLQAVFVDIGNNRNAFLHIKDILPKENNQTGNKLLNFDNIDIKKYVKVGMPIIVQVKKDQVMQKGPRVSTHLNIPGRFIVCIPGVKFITISQKIDDIEEINRLKKIISNNMNEDLGIIIRTSAKYQPSNVILEDLKSVINNLKRILHNFEEEKNKVNIKPKVLYENNKVIDRLLIDFIDKGIDRIIVDDNDIYNYVFDFLKYINKEASTKIEITPDSFDLYNVKNQLEKLKNRKIWLKCGGFITIDKTEALTAIDVNTGKYTGKEHLEDTIFTVNKDATIEIAKQLKLRDIGRNNYCRLYRYE